MKLILALAASAALVSGCSSIGTVNGVPITSDATLSTQNGGSFCQQNAAVCTVGAIVALGLLVSALDDDNDEHQYH